MTPPASNMPVPGNRPTLREEVIQVRRGQPHTERVVITRHGPLISGLIKPRDNTAKTTDPAASVHLALRWTGYAAGQIVRAILASQSSNRLDHV